MICVLYCCVTVIQYITVSGGTCDVLFVFWQFERFALLKSPRMIKAESKCCCSVSLIRSASFCKAELTCACGGTDVELPQRIERLAVSEERF